MKVVVAIDLSPYTSHVIDTILRRRWSADTQFKIVTVIEPLVADDLDDDELSETINKVMKRRQTAALCYCQEVRKQLQGGIEGSTVHIDIRHGSPREELINAATEWNADKIVIGAHGKDLCQRFLWGGVSRAVAAHSTCPVEIVRGATQGSVKRSESSNHTHAGPEPRDRSATVSGSSIGDWQSTLVSYLLEDNTK